MQTTEKPRSRSIAAILVATEDTGLHCHELNRRGRGRPVDPSGAVVRLMLAPVLARRGASRYSAVTSFTTFVIELPLSMPHKSHTVSVSILAEAAAKNTASVAAPVVTPHPRLPAGEMFWAL